MASICLFDMDLYYGIGYSPPNLELMKMADYFLEQGHIVNLGDPKEDLGRYNQIIYFKDRTATRIPKNIRLTDKNVQYYGYGFYKRFIPINEKYQSHKPNYLIYDTEMNSIKNLSKYKKIKKNSLVRVENSDFTDFKKNAKNIYVVDHDFCYLPNAENFIDEFNLKYQLHFLNPLRIKEEKSFFKFYSAVQGSENFFLIDFKFTPQFFFKNYSDDRVLFSCNLQEGETQAAFIERIIKMFIYSKIQHKKIKIAYGEQKNEYKYLYRALLKWKDVDSEELSAYTFFESKKLLNKQIMTILLKNSKLRLLCKTKPKNFSIANIDFFPKI